jgi:hypothetical protein
MVGFFPMDGGASSLIKDPFCPVIIGAGIADLVAALFLQERAGPLRKIPIPMTPFIPGVPAFLLGGRDTSLKIC